MKEKKWLLLFALVLIGVLGISGKSYAATTYSTEEILEYFQENCLMQSEEENLFTDEEAMARWEEIKSECSQSSMILQKDKSAVTQVMQGGKDTDLVWLMDFGSNYWGIQCYYVQLLSDGRVSKVSDDFNVYSSCTYTDYDDTGATNGTYNASGGGSNRFSGYMYANESEANGLYGYSKIYTNVPIFLEDDKEAIANYLNTGDTSGAVNASIINPEPETSYTNKNLYLKNIQYTSSYLKLRPVGSAYAEWSYFPVYDGYDLDNCELEVYYEWSYGAEALSKKTVGISDTFYSTESYSLSEKRNGISFYPYAVICNMILDLPAVLRDCLQGCCFGGSFSGLDDIGNFYGILLDGSQLLQMSSSIMKVSFRVKGKSGNNYQYGKMYTYVIDLLTGETEEHVASSDDEGNYTNNEQYKVYDTDGNVTVKTDATSGGSSSSSDNSFTVQDGAIQINVNPTFNVEGGAGGNGGDGGDGGNGGNGGWSFDFGSSGDNDGDGEDDGGGIHGISIKEFLALITGGIGLLGSNGLVSMLAETFSFVPEEFWRVVIFGMVAMIVVAIMRKF